MHSNDLEMLNAIYCSCNKKVIFLFAGKYAVDVDHKQLLLTPAVVSVKYDFLGPYIVSKYVS